MTRNNLINKFNQIEELPVSEEMLGAYLEGKLDAFDAILVENAINQSDEMRYLSDEIGIYDETDTYYEDNESSYALSLDEINSQIPDIETIEALFPENGNDSPEIDFPDILNNPENSDFDTPIFDNDFEL